MFSVRFRRVHRRVLHRVCRRVCRRKNFCLTRQNHLSKTLHIWLKEYMGRGKCTGWPFHDLDPKSRLWHRLAKICLSGRWSENNSSDHYKTLQPYWPSHGYYLIRFWRSSVRNCYFGKFSLKNLDVFFSRPNTILAISQQWLVRLMWNKKEVHPLHVGYNMWPWPLTSLMTLTLDVSR